MKTSGFRVQTHSNQNVTEDCNSTCSIYQLTGLQTSSHKALSLFFLRENNLFSILLAWPKKNLTRGGLQVDKIFSDIYNKTTNIKNQGFPEGESFPFLLCWVQLH